jgi:mRNA-degrading endonuclease YafQ of YafQ-DinJ toxin-antitoxin module
MEQAFYFADDNEIKVSTFATFYPEDEEIVPKWMLKTELLEMSALDLQDFGIPRKLPLFREILQKLYDFSDADYFIQTNADIGLMPYFYVLIKDLIDAGHDAFCINKRILPEEFKDKSLSVMWSTIGESHAGHDCFVFRRELWPLMNLGDIVMGTPWSETTLIANLVAYAKNFTVYKNAHATFNLGDSRIWLGHEYNDYRILNTNEFAKILKKLSKRNKKILKHEVIQYLLGKLEQEVLGYSKETYSKDCWYFLDKRLTSVFPNMRKIGAI